MRIAVTGANGYVGGRLVEHLVTQGHDVVAVVRSRAGGQGLRPGQGPPSGRLRWVEFGPESWAAAEAGAELARLLGPVEAIVHLAGGNEVAASERPRPEMLGTIDAAMVVAETAGELAIRLVALSTIHVYGSSLTQGAIVNETTPCRPVHPYALARLSVENIALALNRPRADILQPAADAVVLRLTNGVGAPAHARVDRWSLVANDLARQAVVDGQLKLLGDGRQWRDFVGLGEVCLAIEATCRRPDPGAQSPSIAVPAGVYNLGSGVSSTVMSLAQRISEIAVEGGDGTPLAISLGPTRGPSEHYRVDVSLLAGFGVECSADVDEEIRATLAVLRSQIN